MSTPRGRRGRTGNPSDPAVVCARCGRRMPAGSGAERRWCSAACRATRLRPEDHRLEAAILELLDRRPRGATICPSEAARVVADDWRPLMERARMAARRLVARGEAEITQGGRVVDPSTAKGPVRVRRLGGTAEPGDPGEPGEPGGT